MSLVAALFFFNNIYWCPGSYGIMRFAQGFPIKHVVPVWFHVVPILPQSVRFIVSPGPGAQKPCGSCVVPRGSTVGVTQGTAIPSPETMWFLCGSTWFQWRRSTGNCYSLGGFPTNHVVPVWFHVVPTAPHELHSYNDTFGLP